MAPHSLRLNAVSNVRQASALGPLYLLFSLPEMLLTRLSAWLNLQI